MLLKTWQKAIDKKRQYVTKQSSYYEKNCLLLSLKYPQLFGCQTNKSVYLPLYQIVIFISVIWLIVHNYRQGRVLYYPSKKLAKMT